MDAAPHGATRRTFQPLRIVYIFDHGRTSEYKIRYRYVTTSTLSPKYLIVIPKGIRNVFRLKPGQCLQVSAKGTHIEVRPILGPNELIGMLKSDKTLEFERDADRDFSPFSRK